MTYKILRSVAGAIGFAAALAACDSSTQPSGDINNPPTLRITVAGMNAANRVTFGTPVTVTVTAQDDISLLRMTALALRDTAGITAGTAGRIVVTIIGVDTTFHSAQPSYTTTFSVGLQGARSGDTVRVSAGAMDGNGAITLDSVKFVMYDSIPPVVRLTAPLRGATLKSQSLTDSVRLTANDSSGLTSVGYEVLTVAAGALNVRYTVLTALAVRPTVLSQSWLADFDTLAPGSYLIRARATDATGLTSFGDTIRFNIADAIPPVATILSPTQGAPLLIGDSVDIRTALSDNVGLRRFTLKGFSVRGDPQLGATDTVVLYDSISFIYTALTTVDTLSRRMRYNRVPTTAADLEVIFRAVVTDLSGNADTVYLRQPLVSGPKVTVVADSTAWRNRQVTVNLTVMDSTPSIRSYGYTATMSNGVVIKDTTTFTAGPQLLTSATTFFVPANAPIGGSITIVPRAMDAGGNIGSGNTVIIPIIAEPSDNVPPTVYQAVPPRFEQGSIVKVDAHDPSSIRIIGFEMRTLPDSVLIASGVLPRAAGSRRTNDTASFVINYDKVHRGKRAFVVSYAEDSLGNRGYSLPNGQLSPTSNPVLAKRDSALLVYGVTYALPGSTVADPSLGADIAVDTNATRKRVFVTDVRKGGIFVWEDSSATRPVPGFRPTKISVGAFPWGMALDTSGNKLFVANSGGTNIDVVDLNTLSDIRGARVQTPGTALYDVAWSVNATTGILKYSGFKAITYSDRPQYIAQSANGNLYFSTRPTSAAPEGTLRRIDDPLGRPRMRQIWQYASAQAQKHSIFNADSVFIYVATGPSSDAIQICDSDVNTNVAYCSGIWTTAPQAMSDPALTTHAVDVELVNDIDVNSLSLPDTNFVAAGTDGRRIAFGEGATGGRPGRVVTVFDTLGMTYNQAVYSRPLQIRDLVNNASDQIFGIAFNKKSNYLAIHGAETFFADTALRLQGKFGTAARGAGIAFNPGNDSKNAADAVSQAFVASADSTVEVVDSYYFRLRQKLPLRTNLYGALRVWYNPNPGNGVILKLYGLTAEGMVVIDVRPEDLLQLP